MAVKLAIIQPNLREQVYSCHGCGNCCRDFTVQLRDDDLVKLESQRWAEKLGFEPTVEFRGTRYLRQTSDGACVFWMEDGRCRIHAEYGFGEKPIACQMFPFSLTPARDGAVMGINFACQSVLENKGADLASHQAELRRMARALPEVQPLDRPPMLTRKLRASYAEVQAVTSRVDAWLTRPDVDLPGRLAGLAWVVDALGRQTFDDVDDGRFIDPFEALFAALPDAIEHIEHRSPASGQRKMLRQAVFARVEDPKIGRVEKRGRARTSVAQLMRSRRFAKGKGDAPTIGSDWPDGVRLEDTERVEAARDANQAAAIDDLITRWLRATVLGGRAWGAGYYGWPIVDGLAATMLNVAVVGWLSRLHAVGCERDRVSIEDVRAAIGRVDRTAGRARWLGGSPERLRLKYFRADDGLRRLVDHYGFVDPD